MNSLTLSKPTLCTTARRQTSMYHVFEEEDDPRRDPETGLQKISTTQDLSKITYSREVTVAAFRDYYDFLISMYLDEDRVLIPPEEGWPDITIERMSSLGKTDEVIELLRRMPHMRWSSDGTRAHTLGQCQFAHWVYYADLIASGDAGIVKGETESTNGSIPPHVVGLTNWGNGIYLDTRLGVIYFVECPDAIKDDPNLPYKPICDDPYMYSPPEEAEWRGWGAAWGIREFFEVMKYLFRELHYVPVSRLFVEEMWEDDDADTEGARASASEIFRRHGWPDDLGRYRKKECLDEVEAMIEECWPNMFFPW